MEEYFEIQHFAHPEHPLILTDYCEKDPEAQCCHFCRYNLLSSAYSCVTCDFHLHKLCAKLPEQMIHPNHNAEHPLTLVRSKCGASGGEDRNFKCDICSKERYGFGYRCESCDFDVDVRCASLAQAINHKGHLHPLHPVRRTSSFVCDGCLEEHSAAGVSYQCSTCDFWVHEDCATLPSPVKYRGHVHPLVFINDFVFEERCRICRKVIGDYPHWVYGCRGCSHSVHVKCLAATLLAEFSKKKEVDDDAIDLTKVFHLPLSFQHDDLIAQMIKHLTICNYKEEKAGSQVEPLSHFSHKHPLTLVSSNLQSNNDKGDDSKSKKKKKKKAKDDDLIICNACVLPVSTPSDVYYTCTTCNYVLHEWCAKLPKQLPHPMPPSLTLTLREPLLVQKFAFHKSLHKVCNTCYRGTEGYLYRSESDDYRMDVKCLCLPLYILHKAHEHPLKLQDNCYNEGCVACPRLTLSEIAYRCLKCSFYLHRRCALLPITIVHRYDVKHPFSLTIDFPIKDREDEYVCEFCEEDINPAWWFYHCLPCDQSACAGCIFKESSDYYQYRPPYHIHQ